MNISLPGPLRAFVERAVATGGFGSASEYVRQLIRRAKDDSEAERKLLRAIERGGCIEMDGDYWRQKDNHIAELIRKKAGSRG